MAEVVSNASLARLPNRRLGRDQDSEGLYTTHLKALRVTQPTAFPPHGLTSAAESTPKSTAITLMATQHPCCTQSSQAIHKTHEAHLPHKRRPRYKTCDEASPKNMRHLLTVRRTLLSTTPDPLAKQYRTILILRGFEVSTLAPLFNCNTNPFIHCISVVCLMS
ncbi:hypothetical protein IAQ61_009012 [Plenodomus lingam]|uniref:uncharacterized protein n=1 Tax=Leptosphaeria maculans TaxID=5022 RepID=UPI00332FF9EB|nr:hypothetical protein IAQ61_009012 [Plenodomus lingam]